ncbi:winged helix-turn-helix domain-containing protein [Lysinibacillus fusiformis]
MMDDFIFLLTDKETKYKQIYQQMKTLIMEGTLKKNDSLPSIRKLAETLQVSRNTTLTVPMISLWLRGIFVVKVGKGIL